MLRVFFITNILFSASLLAETTVNTQQNNQIKQEIQTKEISKTDISNPVIPQNNPVNISQPNIKESQKNTISKNEVFKPFTGKVLGNKVRIRNSADLDSHIVGQLNKNDLVLVLKDEKSFWAIKPISKIKGYVYKNYIMDNIVEGDRVNVRLEPNTESPILTQLQNKSKVEATLCPNNNKWFEIDLPDLVCFYVSKEYITQAGDENYYYSMQKRKNEADKLLNSAFFLTQGECKKPFDEMTTQDAINQFDLIIKEYSDFPQHVQQAKEGLALLQDNYLQKKIAYLEAKANISSLEKKEYQDAIEQAKKYENDSNLKEMQNTIASKNLTDKMKFWLPVENSLYLTWSTFHPEKKINDFYKEQEVNSMTVAGIVESYSQAIKNKPGDFIVLKDDSSKAYLYSTKIDLDKYVGKKVVLKVSQRPNNNFAFPAYFVNSIEVQ